MQEGEISDDRAYWLALNILPHEAELRAHLARWRLPGDLDPDDVVQEAYSKFASMASVDHIRIPRNYLYSVARTIVLMHVRRAQIVPIRAIEGIDAMIVADEPSPETQAADREQLHHLAIAVSALREPDRSVFLMRTVKDLPHREIGKRLGISDNAVQKSVTRSLLRLMSTLGRGGNGPREASIEGQNGRTQKVNAGKKDKCGE